MLGASLTALCSWRLVWAYRIDMLRELAGAGPRLVENRFTVIAIGAALAGNAVLAHDSLAEAGPARRAFAAVLAWIAWLAIAALVVDGADGLPPLTVARAGALGLSVCAALAPVACALAARVGVAARARARPGGDRGRRRGGQATPRRARRWSSSAWPTRSCSPAHAALRRLLVRETRLAGRCASVVLLAVTALALARYDAGVTLAIAGLGLTFAMLVAGHDAAYDASQAARIGVLEREHARLLAVHGAAGIALAIGVAACALVASDHELIVDGATLVVHAPLVVAVLFAAAAIIARSHRRGWAPWLCAALAALAVWGARDAVVERATGGDNVGARRVAAVLDPGYAVLRDERTFVANASAWREAALPRTGAVDRWVGEGYFGARVRDLGVARSIDNDYLPVLVARETGIGGLTQTIGLLLAHRGRRRRDREPAAAPCQPRAPRALADHRGGRWALGVPAARRARRPAADRHQLAWARHRQPGRHLAVRARRRVVLPVRRHRRRRRTRATHRAAPACARDRARRARRSRRSPR